MTRTTDALDLIRGEPVEEIPLDPTPLARVVAQVRFAQMGKFQLQNPVVGLLRSMIADDYPLYEQGFEKEITVGPAGMIASDSQNPLWRFKTADEFWIATVTPSSLALETTRYVSRPDFVERFTRFVEAFVREVGHSSVSRLGVRYTNFIESGTDSEEELVSFFHYELRGPINISKEGVGLRHGLSDMAIQDGSHGLQGKWGILPPGALFDPALTPTSKRTALLDIDSFNEQTMLMTPELTANEINSLAAAAYRLFRAVTSDDFIDSYRADQ